MKSGLHLIRLMSDIGIVQQSGLAMLAITICLRWASSSMGGLSLWARI